jgi:hypothetical protein
MTGDAAEAKETPKINNKIITRSIFFVYEALPIKNLN